MFRKHPSILLSTLRRCSSACATVVPNSSVITFPSASASNVVLGTPALVCSTTNTSALSSSLNCPLRASFSVRCYGPQDGRRLTFDERSDRRLNKNRQNREERQALVLEAEKIASIELAEELEHEFNTFFSKAQFAALKITNMQRCLETVEIDVGGRKIPLQQAGQIVKISPLELHIIPLQPAFASPILQRLMRFDSTISAQKEQAKIKLTLQRITTQRRDKAAADIKAIATDFAAKLKVVRTKMVKLLQSVGAGDDTVQQLVTSMDTTIKEFGELKHLEFEELMSTVQSTGVDESDESM